MNTVETSRVVEGGLSGFQKGVELTGGELQMEIVTPDYMKAGDSIGGLTEERALNGYHSVTINYSELDSATWMHGRVLLLDDTEKGFLPVVIMPDPKGRARHVRFVKFDQPYNPENGLDEGQLLALSFETTTKGSAGFGGHHVTSKFEGGHFAVATLANRLTTHQKVVSERKHAGAHEILDGSVATDFAHAKLDKDDLGNPIPRPTYRDIDLSKMPSGSSFKARWHDKMVNAENEPVVAAHPHAAQILLGTVIMNLGDKGIDQIGTQLDSVRAE